VVEIGSNEWVSLVLMTVMDLEVLKVTEARVGRYSVI
jgi:hypothetical protein